MVKVAPFPLPSLAAEADSETYAELLDKFRTALLGNAERLRRLKKSSIRASHSS